MDSYVPGSSHSAPPAFLARRLAFGHRITRMVMTAVTLRLPDHLKREEPQTAATLADLVGANPIALERLLCALSAVDVVRETPDGRFVLTDVGAALRSDVPGSIKSWILLEGSDFLQDAWSKLTNTILTGHVAFNEAHGISFYQYIERHPDVAAVFHSMMSEATALIADAVIEAYEFLGAPTIVDVGGGVGTLLLRILQSVPAAKGILFDVPAAMPTAKANITQSGCASRCSFVGGDFFASVPENGDVYLMSRVIMDYDDTSAAHLLRQCRNAMAPGGKVLVLQQLLQRDRTSDWGARFESLMSDVNMLVLKTGRERTEQQYRDLFESAGLTVRRVIPTRSPVSIAEGVRAD
jgi:ubiquinone/menaquinone biosynthesis C-methylase UbiE